MTEPEKINWDLYNTREEITEQILKVMSEEVVRFQKMGINNYPDVLAGFNYELGELAKVAVFGNGYPTGNLATTAQACIMMIIEGMVLAKEQGTKTPEFPKSEINAKDISSTDISSN